MGHKDYKGFARLMYETEHLYVFQLKNYTTTVSKADIQCGHSSVSFVN